MMMNTPAAARPVLIVPYVWIGDFVRCHSVVRVLNAQDPERPVDMVSSTLCAPLVDYMPGVRRAIVAVHVDPVGAERHGRSSQTCPGGAWAWPGSWTSPGRCGRAATAKR